MPFSFAWSLEGLYLDLVRRDVITNEGTFGTTRTLYYCYFKAPVTVPAANVLSTSSRYALSILHTPRSSFFVANHSERPLLCVITLSNPLLTVGDYESARRESNPLTPRSPRRDPTDLYQ